MPNPPSDQDDAFAHEPDYEGFAMFSNRISCAQSGTMLHSIRLDLLNYKGLTDVERDALNESIKSRFCSFNAPYAAQKGRW